MPTVRRRPSKTKQTARAKKSLTEQQKRQAASVGKCCDECIAKLKAHHANRTAEGEAKFVAMLVEILSFAASKQATSVRRSLNGLSYKGKVRLKDTSEAELTRFAKAAYADRQFMKDTHIGGALIIVITVSILFSATAASVFIELGNLFLNERAYWKLLKKPGMLAMTALGMYAGVRFAAATMILKNVATLQTIVHKHS